MKLYVGNLPPAFGDQDLQDLFSSYGEIKSSKVILDRDTGKSKGFGFVEFESREDAQKAIEEMDKKVVGKGAIIVNEARPPQNRNRSGGAPFERRGGGGGGFERRSGGGGGFERRGSSQEKRGDRFNKRFS